MRIPSIFLVFSLMFASIPAMAEWVYLGSSSSDGGVYFYGNTKGRTATRAWFDARYVEPKVEPWGLVQSSKSLIEASCREGKLRYLQEISYDPKGRVLVSRTIPSNWAYVVPDTGTEGVYNFICKRQPK